MKSISSFKKTMIIALLTMFLLVSLFFPKNVQAQFADIAHLAMQVGKWVFEKTQGLLKKAWESGGAIAYRNGLNLFLGQMAKESAEYIASGGKGQKPMFVSDPDYWTKLGDQVLGEYIDETAKSVTGFTGRSLCDPIDPTIRFNLLVGLDYKYQEMMFKPEMRCSWSQIKERYKDLSKKKLFAFSAELQEGGAARLRAEQAAKVQGGTCFTNGEKEEILEGLNKLDKDEKFVAEKTEKLKKNTEGTETLSDNALTQIEKDLQDKVSEIKKNMKDIEDTDTMKTARQCSRITFKATFCEDVDCLLMTAYDHSIYVCKEDFEKYRKCTEDFIAEIKRVADAGNKLIGEIESILNAFPDLIPSPPPTLEDINRGYNPEASDVAVAFKVQSDLFAKQAEAIEKSKFMQSLSGDINRLTSKISDITLTPASGIRAQWETSIKEGTAGIKEYTGVPVADAIGVFTNTLVNKLVKQLFEKGLNPSVSPEIVERTQPFLSDSDELNSPTQKESEVLYTDLAMVSVKKGGEVTIYDEFAVCPDDKKYALPTNCLLDTKLVRAIEEGLTIKEAMEKGWLASTQLVGKSGDYTSLLSWPNIKKLRRYRVFPLGLEIAADKIFNNKFIPPKNVEVSLGQVVSDFDKPDSDFYHLVDPNWVLKASTYKCDIKSYSAIPLPESAQRQETCVNLQDCIHENEEGQCDTWAYCTREKNIWRFNGNACDPQYASCQTYKRTKDKKQFSYLTDTLDFTNCNQNNAGCKWYCSYWDENIIEGGNWNCPNASNVIFFNNKTEKCSAQNQGCHEYIRIASGLETNLVFNGGFELDTDVNGVPDGWTSPWEGTETIDKDKFSSGFSSCRFEHTGADGTSDWTGFWQLVPVVPGKQYTISARVKIETAPSDTITVNYYFDDDGIGYIEGFKGETTIVIDGSKKDWQRHVQTITVPKDRFYVWLAPILYGDGLVYIDDIKLESGNTDSSYKDYGEVNKIYFKNALECQPGEVGCELYTPTNGDTAIQGIVEEKDKCGFTCLGYETFQEMSSNFDFDTRVVNFIPSTAKTCAVSGCEEFTNLDTEKVEYYSYLRQCVKINSQGQAVIDNDGTSIDPPNGNSCKKYYTWVGSETTGYQLKKYDLKKADQQYAGDPDANGPMNFNSNPNLDWGDCEDKEDALDNPHCKQFYDAEGKIYYRLYKNTISCAEDCVSYRRSIDQSIKTAVVSESEICSKKDDRCREYKGSRGDNVIKVFSDDFEGDVMNSRWGSGGEAVAESVNYPGHSLKVDNADKKISLSVDDLVLKNKSYFVSFWFKGGTGVTVKFSSCALQTKMGLNPFEWQEIKFNQFYFDEEPLELEKLEISVPSGSFYIDNVVIKETQDNLYLIKGSWQTSCSCDTLANHNFYSTGAKACTIENTSAESMVGCQVYQGRDKQSYYLKSFTKLCSTVGCEALIDTQNSDWPLGKTFNSGGSPEDNVVIPADKMVYLVNDAKNKCESKYQGCQKFGQPKLDTEGKVVSYADVYLINDPDLYVKSPTLCLKEDVGCEEYQGPFYFKDPGEKTCEYKENVPVGTNEFKTGWFKTGTIYPCYYNDDNSPYQINGIIYGIRFNDDPRYQGWAGSCPTDQSGCVKFTDPLGGEYYYLNNNKIDKSSCQGMVGLKDGCVLFNDTSQSSASLFYDSSATYANSKNNNDFSVPAVIKETAGTGDSNVILKVKRDRVCGEWLDCIGSREVWDPSLGERREICEFVGRCDELIGAGENKICGNWVFYSTPQPLTESVYTDRDVSWSGMDYSGHSILDMYPIETLFAEEELGIYKLTYIDKDDGKEKGVNGVGKTIAKTCQIFPEKDSPFPQNSGGENVPKNEYYNDVNVCSDVVKGNYPDCQCAYKKAEYSGIARYYNYNSNSSDIPNGICASGSNIGIPCTSDNQCGGAGYCSAKSKETTAIGLRGFCLEKDESKPAEINACLTWWPGPGIGDPDIFEHYLDAGYHAANDRQWYGLDQIPAGPHWENIMNSYYDGKAGVYRNGRVDNVLEVDKKIISNVKIKMNEIDKITLRIGVDRLRNNCQYDSCSDCLCKNKILNSDNEWHESVEDTQGKGATTEVTAHFDGNNFLDHLYIKCIDGSGKGNSNISSHRVDRVNIYLKNGCQFMVKIPAGGDGIVEGAYTDLLWSESSYYSTHNGTAGCSPYGAYNQEGVDRLILPGTDSVCDDKPFLHTETSLKNLFAKISEKKKFNIKGLYTPGTCDSFQQGHCGITETTLCLDESVCPCTDFGRCDINKLCVDNQYISCIDNEDCYVCEKCEGVVSGTCSNDPSKRCINKNDCGYVTGGMTYGSSEGVWDNRSPLPSGHASPVVASVNVATCDENNVCKKSNDGKISIGGQDTGNIERSQSFPAVLKFFAWADKNHMPIKEVSIDWKGDGTDFPAGYNSVVAKNHKPEGECNNSDFGSSANACVEKYFQFTYIYTCVKGGKGWNKYGCVNACCFKPKVYVKDNWGWCTNGVYIGDVNGKRCIDSPTAGISYDGIIIVKP